MSRDQLGCEIEERDIIILAGYFDNVEFYLNILGLSPAEQTDVRKKVSEGTQIAMNYCLLLWRQHNPSTATLGHYWGSYCASEKNKLLQKCVTITTRSRSKQYSCSIK